MLRTRAVISGVEDRKTNPVLERYIRSAAGPISKSSYCPEDRYSIIERVGGIVEYVMPRIKSEPDRENDKIILKYADGNWIEITMFLWSNIRYCSKTCWADVICRNKSKSTNS